MNTVTINGVTITAQGSITVVNNRVFVNGQDVTPDAKQITIQVTGDVPQLTVDACHLLTVTGNVGSLKSTSGDVQVQGLVQQSVTTVSGDVECADVGGGVSTTSGDVSCGSVQGRVSTISGDIRHKKS